MKFIFTFLFITLFLNAFTQADTTAVKYGFSKKYFKSYLLDIRDIAVSPFKASPKQWSVFFATALTDVAIATQDGAIRNFALKNRNATTRNIQQYALEPWGSGKFSLPLLGSFYLFGLINDNERSKLTALLGLKAFVVSGLIVTVPKQVFHRHRPCPCVYGGVPYVTCASETPYEFDGPINFSINPKSFKEYMNIFFQSSDNSFPSGHSVSAFAVATVIAEQYKYKKWVPIVAYSLAGLTAISRIEANKHWASDIFMGAAIGYTIGKFISRKTNFAVNVRGSS